jgi:CrcB protein
MTAVWISLAGGAGAITRYVVDSSIQLRRADDFPIGTLVINVSGSLILGILTGLVIAHGAAHQLRTIAGVGFCGGYTTFSAASIETVRLAQQRRWVECLAYTAGSLLLALLAAGAGLWLTGA